MYNNFDPIAFNEFAMVDDSEFVGEVIAPVFYFNHGYRLNEGKVMSTFDMYLFVSTAAQEYICYSSDCVYNNNRLVRQLTNPGLICLPVENFMIEQLNRRTGVLSLMD